MKTMSKGKKMYLAGEWVEGAGMIEVLDPQDLSLIHI